MFHHGSAHVLPLAVGFESYYTRRALFLRPQMMPTARCLEPGLGFRLVFCCNGVGEKYFSGEQTAFAKGFHAGHGIPSRKAAYVEMSLIC